MTHFLYGLTILLSTCVPQWVHVYHKESQSSHMIAFNTTKPAHVYFEISVPTCGTDTLQSHCLCQVESEIYNVCTQEMTELVQ